MMNDIMTVGIAKGIKASIVKEASSNLNAGTYEIDELVRVRGTVRKGEDSEQVVHMKCDTWNILAVALSKLNGVTVEAIVREAVGLDKDAVTAIKKQASEALDKIKAPAKQVTAGKVTTKLDFSLVKSEQEREQGEEAPAIA
jgi:hypothetical protein